MSDDAQQPIEGFLSQSELAQIKSLLEAQSKREVELQLAQTRRDLEVERSKHALLKMLAPRGICDIDGVNVDLMTGHYKSKSETV